MLGELCYFVEEQLVQTVEADHFLLYRKGYLEVQQEADYLSLVLVYLAYLQVVFGGLKSSAYAFEGTGEGGCLLVFLEYFSEIFNEPAPTHYFVGV